MYNINDKEELREYTHSQRFAVYLIKHKGQAFKVKTCREKGAMEAYNERLKQNKALAEYRRLYQLKSMAVGRNKDNKQLKKDFDKWKKDAKDRVNKLKHGVLTEDEVYDWLVNNKLSKEKL